MNIVPPNDISEIFETFLQIDSQKFSVERNGKIIACYDGLANSYNGKNYIGFRPGTDVQPGDWIINSSGERFYVNDRETDSVHGKPNELKIFYDTEAVYNKKKSATAPAVFNISNASGSIIGNYNTISVSYKDSLNSLKLKVENIESPDKEELRDIVNLLEMIVDNKVPATKGIFSKFSSLMEKHSWLSSSIAGTIFSWLTNLF